MFLRIFSIWKDVGFSFESAFQHPVINSAAESGGVIFLFLVFLLCGSIIYYRNSNKRCYLKCLMPIDFNSILCTVYVLSKFPTRTVTAPELLVTISIQHIKYFNLRLIVKNSFRLHFREWNTYISP